MLFLTLKRCNLKSNQIISSQHTELYLLMLLQRSTYIQFLHFFSVFFSIKTYVDKKKGTAESKVK